MYKSSSKFFPSSRFWKVAACLPLATAALSSSAQTTFTPTASGQQETGNWTFHHEHVLGTSLEVTVRAASLSEARKAEAAVLAAFDRDEAVLSTWRQDSEASRWSRTSLKAVPVSQELFAVLTQFDQWRGRTGGALDASVEAATRLWRGATAENRVPSDREIAVAVEAMQQPHWVLDREHQTAMRLSDVPLALASFTKSYISSRATDAAIAAGATGVMVNVGGDVVVRGDMIQVVALANPQAASENDVAMEHIAVRDRAVATSGSYRRGFELASSTKAVAPQFSHLIDPRSAQPAHHVLSSTVISQDAVTAGALATAFSILPVAESRTLAASMPEVQYLLVLANGEQVRSANWPQAPGLRPAAFERVAKAAAPTSAGMWNPAFELSLDLTLPRIDDARYRRPYVAVWIEDADHFPVRTLALWMQKPRWISELKQWYRDDQVRTMTEGSDISKTISSATRPPGSYTLNWDGKDNEGKLVKAGRYTICIEAAREHGGYDVHRQEWEFGAKVQQVTLPAGKELGAVKLDYHKR
jgi:thiamine biosynthesis lipoprotein